VKKLQDGSLAVGLFYVGEESPSDAFFWDGSPKNKHIHISWEELGISGFPMVRDVWRQTDLGSFKTSYTASVPYHGVVLLRIKEI